MAAEHKAKAGVQEIRNYTDLTFSTVKSIVWQRTVRASERSYCAPSCTDITSFEVKDNGRGGIKGWSTSLNLTSSIGRIITFEDAARTKVKDIQDTYYQTVAGRGRAEDYTLVYDNDGFQGRGYSAVIQGLTVKQKNVNA